MRRLTHFSAGLFLLLGSVVAAQAQAQRPQFRPAVLITGPDSLLNRIEAKALFEAGQREGVVMFCARATKEGRLAAGSVYHGSPGSEKLAAEVTKQLPGTKTAPAIYDYQPVEAVFYGTVTFSVSGEKPQVRIFLNHDAAELKKGSDFIGPQPVYGGDSAFSGFHYPASAGKVPVSGLVGVSMKLDAQGIVQEMRVLNEDPPLLGFGLAAANDLRGAKFIPAFRDGDADACNTVLAVYYPTD